MLYSNPGIRVISGLDFARKGGGAQYYLDFNGSTSRVNCGSDASIDDFWHSACTVEAWVKPDSTGEGTYGRIINQGAGATSGLHLFNQAASGLKIIIQLSGTAANGNVTSGNWPIDSTWRHIAVTYEYPNAPTMWVDGVDLTGISGAGTGTQVSNAGADVIIGDRWDSGRSWDGGIAWLRISDVIRYTVGFTPAAKDAPPASDANTIEQWNFNTGSGTTATAEESSPTNDGTITAESWVAL